MRSVARSYTLLHGQMLTVHTHACTHTHAEATHNLSLQGWLYRPVNIAARWVLASLFVCLCIYCPDGVSPAAKVRFVKSKSQSFYIPVALCCSWGGVKHI